MFCPKCSQSQISDEVRFCSRCGFPLAGVAELLHADGIPLTVRTGETKRLIPYLQGKGALVGTKIVFFSLLFIPVAFAIAIAANNPAPLLLALIPFIAGAAQILYSVVFGKKFLPQNEETTLAQSQREPFRSAGLNVADTAELPPASTADDKMLDIPESGGGKTAETFTPPSVTDETTKLLRKD